jgi:hypothetical protein
MSVMKKLSMSLPGKWMHYRGPSAAKEAASSGDKSSGMKRLLLASCTYAGMRFDKHEAGIQANRHVRQSGLRLPPELCEVYNPMPHDGAHNIEVELALAVRQAGHGVRQAWYTSAVEHARQCARAEWPTPRGAS